MRAALSPDVDAFVICGFNSYSKRPLLCGLVSLISSLRPGTHSLAMMYCKWPSQSRNNDGCLCWETQTNSARLIQLTWKRGIRSFACSMILLWTWKRKKLLQHNFFLSLLCAEKWFELINPENEFATRSAELCVNPRRVKTHRESGLPTLTNNARKSFIKWSTMTLRTLRLPC